MGLKTEGERHLEQGKRATLVTVDRVDVHSVNQKATPQAESGRRMIWEWGEIIFTECFQEVIYFSFRTGRVSRFQLVCQIWSTAKFPGWASSTMTICEVHHGWGWGRVWALALSSVIPDETIIVYPWIKQGQQRNKCIPGLEGFSWTVLSDIICRGWASLF